MTSFPQGLSTVVAVLMRSSLTMEVLTFLF
jgi:hypothetical protein